MLNQAFVFLCCGAQLDAVETVLIKYWINKDSHYCLLCGILFYLFSIGFLILGLKTKSILEATLLFIVLNVILIAVANHLIFSTHLRPKD